MSCCSTADCTAGGVAASARDEEMRLAATRPREGVMQLRLSAPDLRCGACVASVERALADMPGVEAAQANLTAKTITVEWREGAMTAGAVARVLEHAGFRVFPLDDGRADAEERAANAALLTRVAVSGFAAANIMLLSVSVWAGAEGATRDLLHWVAALIALPAVVYAGRPFFVSALAGLRAGRLNMDAPISLAIILATAVSFFELTHGGSELYFDAAVSLIFLLLIGRWLDGVMRAGARSAARSLVRLTPRGAWVLDDAGARAYRPLESILVGDRVATAPGDRLPIDGVVTEGAASLDRSLLTGESDPIAVGVGDAVEAGALALDGALTIRATRPAAQSTLAEIAKLVAAAEERKSGLARLADKAAQIYAPVVHLTALAVLIGWLWAGLELREAVMIAVAVLIVTCPCALGLAAPMAQAVASGALFRRGIMLKDGAALERLATVRRAGFDKTGVLTLGEPRVTRAPAVEDAPLGVALGLATASRHPLSRAIAEALAADRVAAEPVEGLRETPGGGVEAVWRGRAVRLGSAAFCGVSAPDAAGASSEVWLAVDGVEPARFELEDALRPDAAATLAALKAEGVAVEMLTGDRQAPAARAAASLGGVAFRAELSPQDKIAAIEAMRGPESERQKGVTLMVGDGLNDAPALAAADVSIAPASASDVGRASADLVFTGRSLAAVTTAFRVAKRARAVILQNFGLAAAYNLVSIPLAASGYIGPLEAAIAMSSSSLLVTLNALRIAWAAPQAAAEADILPPCPRAEAEAAAALNQGAAAA